MTNRKSTGLYIIITMVVLFHLLFLIFHSDYEDKRYFFKLMGSPYAFDIYNGQFWGVLTNSLLHTSTIHLLINVALFLLFARRVERSYGFMFFAFFGFIASVVTSCAQLAMSGDPGLGLTGVNIAFLYFMLGDSNAYWKKAWISTLAYVLGVGTLLFAAVNYYYQWIPFGMSSAVAGIVYGFVTGKVFNHFKRRFIWMASSFLLAFSSLVYNPFSSEWNTYKGYISYENDKNELAKWYYRKAIELSPKNVVARENLRDIYIDELSEQAYLAHKAKEYTKARVLYKRILKVDPKNSWAIKNMKNLP